MVSVFFGYVVEGLFLALAAFLFTSWVVGRFGGSRAGLSSRLRVAGWLLTAIGAATSGAYPVFACLEGAWPAPEA